MSTATIARKASEIQSAVLYRCSDKATHEVFYLVASDNQPGVYYTVRFDSERVAWTCSCPANKPCKHERAVQEVLKIRRARIAEKIGGDMPAVVAQLEAEMVLHHDEQAHVEDSNASGEFASCYGCGQRVKHTGYCYQCDAA